MWCHFCEDETSNKFARMSIIRFGETLKVLASTFYKKKQNPLARYGLNAAAQ